jgi:hypothetical protein
MSSSIEAHVDATAALIGLPIPPEYRDGVVRYFGLAAQLAELVMTHPLKIEDEPGAIFVPVVVTEAPPSA